MAEDRKETDRPAEQPAMRTTIVGGRPPGPGRGLDGIPRGIEVLVKKASVDPEFKKLLLERRAEAAGAIELELDETEAAMIDGIPAAQLEAIIAHTTVSPMTRAAFLGKAATVMVAALGAAAGCEKPRTAGISPDPPATDGIRPDRPRTKGIQPDRPTTKGE